MAALRLTPDCWQVVLGMLDDYSMGQASAASRHMHQQVTRLRYTRFVFALQDNQESAAVQQQQKPPRELPRFVGQLACPTLEWSTRWSTRVGFHPASLLQHINTAAGPDNDNDDNGNNNNNNHNHNHNNHNNHTQQPALDAAGWNCRRPLHGLEQQLVASLRARHNTATSLRLLDQRPHWNFWDSLSLHPALVEHLFVHCKSLRDIHIEHFCLTSLLSLQNAPGFSSDNANGNNGSPLHRQEQQQQQEERQRWRRQRQIHRGPLHRGGARAPANGPAVSGGADWTLPHLQSLRLLDTELDAALMKHLARCTPNLRLLHVHKVCPDVTEADFHALLAALPRLRDVRIGYSFHRGMRSRREAECASCAHRQEGASCSSGGGGEHGSAACDGRREFHVCARERMDEVTCAALLAACTAAGALRSLHLFGLGGGDRHHGTRGGGRPDAEAEALESIFLHSLGPRPAIATAAASGGGGGGAASGCAPTLCRLHLGAAVPLAPEHLAAICDGCPGLQYLTLRTKLDRAGLGLVCERLGGLRRLSFVVNRAGHGHGHGGNDNDAFSDAWLTDLARLPALEELQLQLHGSSRPLRWFHQHMGDRSDPATPEGPGEAGSEEAAGEREGVGVPAAAAGVSPAPAAGVAGGGSSASANQCRKGLSDAGVAGLLALPALRRVFLGTQLVAGVRASSPASGTAATARPDGGGGGGGGGGRRAAAPTRCPVFFDDSEFEQKAEDRHLSLAEWVRAHRPEGTAQLAHGLRQRAWAAAAVRAR